MYFGPGAIAQSRAGPLEKWRSRAREFVVRGVGRSSDIQAAGNHSAWLHRRVARGPRDIAETERYLLAHLLHLRSSLWPRRGH